MTFAVLALMILLSTTAISFVQGTGHHADITYVQPQRFINCSADADPCEFTLTVSSMQTLNAYDVTQSDERGGSSYPITINENGGFDFVYDNTPPSTVTRLFQPIIADGTTRRNLLVINDQLPGPTLIGYVHQRIRITVINDLNKDAITLHWHGMHVNGSQYMDGVPFVTQCPILPGNTFVYDFNLFPSGTYWYHSHQYDERSNGMYGALIVLDQPSMTTSSPPPYLDIPEEHTIAFFEWFPLNSDEWIEAPFSLPDPLDPTMTYSSVPTIDGTEAGFPPFYAGLFNSEGWRYTQNSSDCRRVANTNIPRFSVTQNRAYRFRLVGSQVNYAYRFSIKDHRLRVIATDGIDATLLQLLCEIHTKNGVKALSQCSHLFSGLIHTLVC